MTILIICGAVLFGAILTGGLAFALPGSRRILFGPRWFPYTVAFTMRMVGRVMALSSGLSFGADKNARTSPEVFAALRSTAARDLLPLRDSYLALDGLPTVARGKTALGLKSVFDVFVRPVHRLASPYTHPLQTPHFFVPGVTARPFYDAAEFPFTQVLEDAYPRIREELMHVISQQRESFQTYRGGHGGLHSGWNNFFFYLFNKKNEQNAALCPYTMSVLDSIPRLEHTMAMFAALNPHSGLPPHTGPFNGILRVHLPLIVPPGCELTVGGETRTWEEGKVTVFDDSFVHSVHNHSDQVRVVLFFTVYHPDFTPEEVPLIQRLNDAWQALPVTRLYEKMQHQTVTSNVVIAAQPASVGA